MTSNFLGFDFDLRDRSLSEVKLYLPFESPYIIPYLTSFDFQSGTAFEIFGFKVFRVRSWSLIPIWKPMHDFLSNFYCYFLTISYRFRDIRLWNFQGLTLTFDLWSSPGVKNIFTIQKPIYVFLSNFFWHFLSISYRFLDIRFQSVQCLTLTFEPLEITWDQKYFHHSKAHAWLPI